MRITCVILFFGVVSSLGNACSPNTAHWKLDAEYSENLTIKSSNYKEIYGANIIDTVDEIRIYRTSDTGNDFLDIKKLLEKNTVLQSNDRVFIENFLKSAQNIVDDIGICTDVSGGDRYHVLMFDNDSRKAGYFLYRRCKAANGKNYGVIMGLQKGGGSSIYYVTMDVVFDFPKGKGG